LEVRSVKRFLLPGLCLVLVPIAVCAQTADQKRATVAYLQQLQQKDGGFIPAPGQAKSSLRATSSALRALKYFGGEAKDKDAAATFVKSCFDKDSGGFVDQLGGKPDVTLTAVGVMAAVELKLSTEPYEKGVLKYLGENAKEFEQIRIAAAGLEALGKQPPQAKDWLEQVRKMANADGTYGKGDGLARDTGGSVVVVLRLGGKVENMDTILKALNAGQRKDGGFGKADAKESDLESSYRVMRAYHMLKAKPEQARALREFVGKCRNEDGGYSVEPGKASSVSGTYFASIILHWLGE
jgi:prenyltransferase beta subunit